MRPVLPLHLIFVGEEVVDVVGGVVEEIQEEVQVVVGMEEGQVVAIPVHALGPWGYSQCVEGMGGPTAIPVLALVEDLQYSAREPALVQVGSEDSTIQLLGKPE